MPIVASFSETIRQLVEQLRRLDPDRRVFGATGHAYRFNPPLTGAQVHEFELRHEIELPRDYREYLTEVGNGGAGPHYGVERLSKASEYSTLSQPFPWRDETTISGDDFALWDDQPGVLVLSERGCGYTDFLVLNGAADIRVWSDFVAGDGGLVPSHPTFEAWYTSWATKCIATIRREPLIDKVRAGMTIDEVKSILGDDIQRWERTPGFDEGFAYYIGFTNTNASFRIGTDDRVVSVYKMDSI